MKKSKMFTVQYTSYDFNSIIGHNATMFYPVNMGAEAKIFAGLNKTVVKIKYIKDKYLGILPQNIEPLKINLTLNI